MLLEPLDGHGVAAYLADRGLLDGVSRDGVTVTVARRRNHDLVVHRGGLPLWFLKQIRHRSPDVVAGLRLEAACYHVASQRPALALLGALMPRCAFFDPENSILVLEHLCGVDGAQAHASAGMFEPLVAARLGQCLAVVHRHTSAVLESTLPSHLPGRLPWAIAEPGFGGAGAGARLLGAAHADPAVARALSALRAAWRRETLIHGDARPDNFLFCRPEPGAEDFSVRVVDWELADLGDAAWDCAAVMQFYWVAWTTAEQGRHAWTEMSAAIEGFWHGYTGRRGPQARVDFDRAIPFTGARLLQAAYEHAEADILPPAAIERIAQAGRLLLTVPGEAAKGFWTS